MSRTRHRTYGFRFSAIDGVFIAICVAGAVWIAQFVPPMVWLIAIVVGHFFLFCNIARLRRSFELVWTGVFIANVAILMWTGRLSWWLVLAIQLPITAFFTILEMRSPRYHGLGARRINPQLDRWLSHEIE